MNVSFQELQEAFRNLASESVSPQEREPSRIVDACVEFLKTHRPPKGTPSIKYIAQLLTAGAKNERTRVQAKKIAEAIYETPLYDKASRSVRREIDRVMEPWSCTWIRAKISGFFRTWSNWMAYGADTKGKQNALLDVDCK